MGMMLYFIYFFIFSFVLLEKVEGWKRREDGVVREGFCRREWLEGG
jgi:hypothetical protein